MKFDVRAGVCAAVFGGLLLGAAPGHASIDADLNCHANKAATLGNYAKCRLMSEAKAFRRGEAADYTVCDDNLATAWTAHDTKGGADCPFALGAVGAYSGQVSAHTDTLAGLLATGVDDQAKCGNAKLKTVARFERCVAGAQQKALKQGVALDTFSCEKKLLRKFDGLDARFGVDCPDGGAPYSTVLDEVLMNNDALQLIFTTP
jgi:hypothetical protein